MQYQQFYAVNYLTGANIPNPTCAVYLTGTMTLASIYDNLGNPLANPFAGSSTGLVGFGAAGGAYDVQISSGAYTAPLITGLYFDSGVTLIASIAALRANAATYPQVYVQGFYAPGDGGQGNFWYTAADTTSADNTGTIIVDGAGHRWYRLYKDTVHSRWWGCVANNIVDDTINLQASYTFAAANSLNHYLDPGTYSISSVSISAATNCVFGGTGLLQSNKGIAPYATYGFVFLENNTNCLFEDFSVRGLGTGGPSLPDNGLGENNNTACIFRRLTVTGCSNTGILSSGDAVPVIVGGASDYHECIVVSNYYGIQVPNGQAYQGFFDCLVTANIYGFYGAFSNSNIRRNKVNGNEYGIYVEGSLGTNSDHGSISENQLNHNIVNGLTINANTNGWSVIDNQMLSNGTGGGGYSLSLNAPLNCVFMGNQIDGGLATNIPVTGGATSCKWIGNRFLSAAPTESAAGTNCAFIGNIYQGASGPNINAGSTGYIMLESESTLGLALQNLVLPGGTVTVQAGANRKSGTMSLTAGAVTVANTSVTTNSVIQPSLKTVIGTVGGQPYVSSITPGTGFQVVGGGGSNASLYNYVILEI